MLLGLAPLVLASGAGVFRGMIGVTLLGIFLTPVFYYAVEWFSDRRGPHESATEPTRAFSDP